MTEFMMANPGLMYAFMGILTTALIGLASLYIRLIKHHYEQGFHEIKISLNSLNRSVTDQNIRHEAWLLNLDKRLTFVEGVIGRYHEAKTKDVC